MPVNKRSIVYRLFVAAALVALASVSQAKDIAFKPNGEENAIIYLTDESGGCLDGGRRAYFPTRQKYYYGCWYRESEFADGDTVRIQWKNASSITSKFPFGEFDFNMSRLKGRK